MKIDKKVKTAVLYLLLLSLSACGPAYESFKTIKDDENVVREYSACGYFDDSPSYWGPGQSATYVNGDVKIEFCSQSYAYNVFFILPFGNGRASIRLTNLNPAKEVEFVGVLDKKGNYVQVPYCEWYPVSPGRGTFQDSCRFFNAGDSPIVIMDQETVEKTRDNQWITLPKKGGSALRLKIDGVIQDFEITSKTALTIWWLTA